MKWLLAAVMLGMCVGCFVDPPDLEEEEFACESGDDCIGGYHCDMQSGGLGICRPDGGSGGSGCVNSGCPGGEHCVLLAAWNEWVCKRACANVGNPCVGYALTPNQCQDVDGHRDGEFTKVNVCVACDEPACQGGQTCDIEPNGTDYQYVAACI